MSHQPLMAESHQDTMFQGYTNANPAMQNAFFASLQNNNVKYFLAGHDHINQHSIIASPDGLSSVHEIIGASDSSKFYTPKSLTDGNWFGQKARETSVAQELYTVGYYIFTVDGANVTVDFYSDNHGGWQSDGSYPLGAGRPDTNITPIFTFAKKQTWGYSQNGTEVLVAQGASYPTTPLHLLRHHGAVPRRHEHQHRQGLHQPRASPCRGHRLGRRHLRHLQLHHVPVGHGGRRRSSGDTIALSMSFDRSSVSDCHLGQRRLRLGHAAGQRRQLDQRRRAERGRNAGLRARRLERQLRARHLRRRSRHQHRLGRRQPRRPIRDRALLTAAAAAAQLA